MWIQYCKYTQAVQAYANVNCYCIICIVQEFLARINWVCYFMEEKVFLTWEKLEDTQNLNKGCRFSQQSSIKSREQITGNKTLSIDYKQRPFRFNESHRNRESRVETQQLRIESRFWRGSRIECQLTFEQYCTYIYLVPCWEFNTKTSFLVLVIVHCTWGYDTNYLEN